MEKYVKYLRVSTKKQGDSGLGLNAQSDIIDYFIKDGKVIETFSEVYTGTDLVHCVQLRKAIDCCKKNGAKLIIYKSDRFRNLDDALAVMAELGEGNLVCCDIPNADRFTFILFFAIAEREALLIALRTKQALKQIKKDIKKNGHHISKKGKKITHLGRGKGASMDEAHIAAAYKKKIDMARDPIKKRQYLLISSLRTRGDTLESICNTLNGTGEKTSMGKEWKPGQVCRAINKWAEYYT